jgi:hypothetical protein
MLLAAASVAAYVSDPADHVTAMLNRELAKPKARDIKTSLTSLSISLLEKLTYRNLLKKSSEFYGT